MKPSKYIKNKCKDTFNNDIKKLSIGCFVWNCNSNQVEFLSGLWNLEEKELDKIFIDREELKDKINKLKKEVKYHKGDDITDMILELLK